MKHSFIPICLPCILLCAEEKQPVRVVQSVSCLPPRWVQFYPNFPAFLFTCQHAWVLWGITRPGQQWAGRQTPGNTGPLTARRSHCAYRCPWMLCFLAVPTVTGKDMWCPGSPAACQDLHVKGRKGHFRKVLTSCWERKIILSLPLIFLNQNYLKQRRD